MLSAEVVVGVVAILVTVCVALPGVIFALLRWRRLRQIQREHAQAESGMSTPSLYFLVPRLPLLVLKG